jgi:hypothetical protein
MVVEVQPTLESEIRKGPLEDEELKVKRQLIRENKTDDFRQGNLMVEKMDMRPQSETHSRDNT